MPKPMRVTDDLLQQVAAEFMRCLPKMTFMDGKISFVKDFLFRQGSRISVSFTREAHDKMWALVDHFETEVAWHGMVQRVDPTHFHIYDIVVYPQVVANATVNTDQEEYDRWVMSIDGDSFNAMKMQGHSHVRMSTSPSAVDLDHQGKIVSQLGSEGFYIFMIVNKRRECTIKVYDAENNTLYENDSIDIIPPPEAVELDKFLTAAEKCVSRTTYARPASAATPAGKSNTPAKSVQKVKAQGKPAYQSGSTSTRRSAAVQRPAPNCSSGFDIDDVSGFLEDVDDFDDFAFGSGYPYHRT